MAINDPLRLYTGQRLGDIAALRWNNLDLARGELRLSTRKTGKVPLMPLYTTTVPYRAMELSKCCVGRIVRRSNFRLLPVSGCAIVDCRRPDEALQVECPLFGPHEWPEKSLDVFVRDALRSPHKRAQVRRVNERSPSWRALRSACLASRLL